MPQDEKPPFRAPIGRATRAARDEEIVLDWRDGATQRAIATKHKVSVETVRAVIRRAVPQEERRARQRSASVANRVGMGDSREDVAAELEATMRFEAFVLCWLWAGVEIENIAAFLAGVDMRAEDAGGAATNAWDDEDELDRIDRQKMSKVRAIIREVRLAAEPPIPDMEHDRDQGLSYTALAAKYGLSPRACQRLIRARKVLAIANEEWAAKEPHHSIRHELP